MPYLLDMLFSNLVKHIAAIDIKKLNFDYLNFDNNDNDQHFKSYLKLLHK